MLDLAHKNSAIILHTSMSEIYGDPLEHPQNERYNGNVNISEIRSYYDEGKRVAETLMFEYARKYKVNIKVVRIFNTYGSKMDHGDGRVVPKFIVQALTNSDITLYGDANQTRSFCYIDGYNRRNIINVI
jgi:UDP-glucuronate decarboxylase